MKPTPATPVNLDTELVTTLVDGPVSAQPWRAFLDCLRARVGAEQATLNISWPSRPFEETLNFVSGGPPGFTMKEVFLQSFYPLTPPLNEQLIEGKAYGLPEWLRISVGLPDENARFLTALAAALRG